MASLSVTGIAELTTNDPALGDGPMGRRREAGLVVDDGLVTWVGDSRDTPAADETLDAAGGAVVPGFVDGHTHLVFAGDRADEFEARMAGVAYEAGGLLRTVTSTRAATTDLLERTTRARLHEMLASGTTTVEVKSGYELTVDGERRLLDVARSVTDEVTFLGAHAVPVEYAQRRAEYVALVAGPMLARCAPVARWADAFCDPSAFTVDECREVLVAARDAGLGLRLHANQFGDSGGVELAAELGVTSVDHCTHVSPRGVAALADRGVVATLVPGAEFCTRSPYANARALLDAGVTVALASDCNPGTSYVTSMPFVLALAVRELHLTPDEALWAATAGGAAALARDDVGRLAPGARGDLVVLDAPSARHLAYRPGSSRVRSVVRAGTPVGVPTAAGADRAVAGEGERPGAFERR